MLVSFLVPGPAVPKGRPRVFQNANTGRYDAVTPERTKMYQRHVGLHALAAKQDFRKKWPMTDVTYGIDIAIHAKKKARYDIDNVAKAFLDALIGVLYDDDRSVKKLSTWLFEGTPKDYVEITVRVLPKMVVQRCVFCSGGALGKCDECNNKGFTHLLQDEITTV